MFQMLILTIDERLSCFFLKYEENTYLKSHTPYLKMNLSVYARMHFLFLSKVLCVVNAWRCSFGTLMWAVHI